MRLHTAPVSPALSATAVEVIIREEYLLRNKTNIARTLCAYSLDNGPWHETDDSKFIFRFTSFDWSHHIEHLLHREHVHCDVVRQFHARAPSAAKRIVVVGCDPGLASDLLSGLENAGYSAKGFSSGKSVMERCWSPVDLFIVDKQLRDIDGLSLCRYLSAYPLTKDVPVILLSPEGKQMKEALLAGATHCVEKPFHIHYLLNVIGEHMRRSG